MIFLTFVIIATLLYDIAQTIAARVVILVSIDIYARKQYILWTILESLPVLETLQQDPRRMGPVSYLLL